MESGRKLRVFLLGNPLKPGIDDVLASLAADVRDVVELVGATAASDIAVVTDARPDLLVVLGGDGSILYAVRGLGERQVPIVGVNLGKLGFLAEFGVDDVRGYLRSLNTASLRSTPRSILDVTVAGANSDPASGLAVNDCVVQAGPPFRMISLRVVVDGGVLTEVMGDGLIVSTPSGSTAHNMSAGGPILLPGVSGVVVTPLCPHSLTHRPLVVEDNAVIEVTALRCAEGTVVTLDGQLSLPFCESSRLTIRRFPHEFRLVTRPGQPRWHTLTTKLGWGRLPTYNGSASPSTPA